MKRVFIIHCWQGTPTDFWYPWLKEQFEAKGFEVQVLEMPETDAPDINLWVPTLAQAGGVVDAETYFVGHSIGCQTIFRYLQTLPETTQLGAVVCVAGWFNLPNLETDEEQEIAKPWLTLPLDTDKLKKMLAGKLVAIFSDDDKHVPITDAEMFKEKLGGRIIIETGYGHFDSEDMTELPTVLTEVLKISN